MSNYETWSLAIGGATLVATIIACIIASQISKRTARYTVHHYINTTVIRWMNLMEEVTALKELPNSATESELVNRIHYDTIEIQSIGMALSLEAGGKNFLKRKQMIAMDKMLSIGRNFWALENEEQRHECIDNIYRALEMFNNFSKRDMAVFEQLQAEMKGGEK